MRLSERGAVIIHVAMALIALLAMTAVVVDQGVMYVSRSQAQAAADSGALAGVTSLVLEPTAYSEATIAAQTFANSNGIWGQAAGLGNIWVSPLPYNCPDGVPACIRVDVMRGLPDKDGGGHANTLPTYLMGIVGLTSQGTRATATAQVGAGNAVQCIKPWVVADKWTDGSNLD